MLTVIQNHDEYSTHIHQERELQREQAIADYAADPSIAEKPIGVLYLDRGDAMYLLDIIPGWIDLYKDMRADGMDDDGTVTVQIEQLQTLLSELKAANVRAATPRQEYTITITPLNDVLGSVLEEQVKHELLDLRDNRGNPKKVGKIADRLDTASSLSN